MVKTVCGALFATTPGRYCPVAGLQGQSPDMLINLDTAPLPSDKINLPWCTSCSLFKVSQVIQPVHGERLCVATGNTSMQSLEARQL